MRASRACRLAARKPVEKRERLEMNPQALFEEVRQVIADVLDDVDVKSITQATRAEDVEGWDSIQHVRILMALERKLKFRFSNDEIEKLKNVGDLVGAVARHIPAST
jgi:acyl carrier protein